MEESDGGEKIIVIFYACQVGATEVDDHGKIVSRTPVVQVFLAFSSNVTVIAPNGFILVSRDKTGKASVVAIQAARGNGEWGTFRKGQIIITQ